MIQVGDTPCTSAVRFEDLNISRELLKGLYVSMKFEMPKIDVLIEMVRLMRISSELVLGDSENPLPVFKRVPVTAQVIGTPGTINKWIAAKKLGTAYMKILVFDEAHHMLSEVVLFSANFNHTVKAFVLKIVNELFVNEYNQLYIKKEERGVHSNYVNISSYSLIVLSRTRMVSKGGSLTLYQKYGSI